MNKYDTVIWDFNGTILDDLQLCRKIINELLQRYQLPTLSTRKYRAIFGFPIAAYYDKTGITAHAPFSVLAEEFTAKYNERIAELKCFPDVRKAIVALNKMGIRQVVISAARQQDLRRQMKDLRLAEYFSDLLGSDNIYAAGKAGLAKAWAKANKARSHKILVIGDSDHDNEMAAILKADCLLISRGHISHCRLLETGVRVEKDAKAVVTIVGGK